MAASRTATRWLNDMLTSALGIRVVRSNGAGDCGYHKWHETSALAALRMIEGSTGCRLTRSLRKQADDYAGDVFGGRHYAPWLYVYSAVNGAFREGWIPDNFFGAVVMPQVNKGLRAMTDFKTFSNVALKTRALPDVAYYVDGIFYSRELKVIDASTLRAFVTASGRDVVIKRDGSNRGNGIARLTANEIDDEVFRRFGNCVIQPVICQHAVLEGIVSGALATIRITTVRTAGGDIDLRAAYLRLGRSGTDWVQSDNSVRVAITDRDGRLDSRGYTSDWRRWRTHPDTGATFGEKHVPRFSDAVKLCVELHRRVPHLAIIGWDVAIDRDGGVVLLEWNGDHCDIKFSEATTGPCFAELNWERFAKEDAAAGGRT